MVAEAKASFDARSVDVSKYKGYEDKYIIVGGYTPAHFVIFDALTLEPLKIVRTGGYDVNNSEYLDEARVAAIVASHKDPLWVVNIKETGQVWLVDYSNIESLKITTIDAEPISPRRRLGPHRQVLPRSGQRQKQNGSGGCG